MRTLELFWYIVGLTTLILLSFVGFVTVVKWLHKKLLE